MDGVWVRRGSREAGRAQVPEAALRELAVRDDPGGMCGPRPRAVLTARVWCDAFDARALGHACGPDGPHELVVALLERDNPADVHARLCGRARGR
jgi:hypothetical protein